VNVLLTNILDLETGSWCIIRESNNVPWVGAMHLSCTKNHGDKMSWYKDEDARCFSCEQPVPDSVQALIYLIGDIRSY